LGVGRAIAGVGEDPKEPELAALTEVVQTPAAALPAAVEGDQTVSAVETVTVDEAVEDAPEAASEIQSAEVEALSETPEETMAVVSEDAAADSEITTAESVDTSEAPVVASVETEVEEEVELVTLNFANGADVKDVLTAFALQSGRSVVLGPEVEGEVRLHLRNVPWDEALDVILKPYGFSYEMIGDTLVVSKMENQAVVEALTPLVTRVFKLHYLDAFAVQNMVKSMLSKGRGELTTIPTRGQKGWGFEAKGTGDISTGGKRERLDERETDGERKAQQLRSRTIVVRDTPSVIEQIAGLLAEIDVIPLQVMIEARIVEVDSGTLRDIGVEFNSKGNFTQGGNLFGMEVAQSVNGPTPEAFQPSSSDLTFSQFDTGLSLLFQKLDPTQFSVLLHMLEENSSLNVLSSPRILTLNNEEAAMVVGEVFPIVETTKTSSGNNDDYTTSVSEWLDIGIQLNVVPQICENHDIRMVVHPVITEIIGFTGGGADDAITQYPRLSTRETETQVILKNRQTLAIGGLFKNQEQETLFKVPFLGDIPLIGVLFRRKTTSVKKMELVIFLTATVVEGDEHELAAGDSDIRRLRETRAQAENALVDTVGSQMNADLRALMEFEKMRQSSAMLAEGSKRMSKSERERRWKAEEKLREELIGRLQAQRKAETTETGR
jgi:type IV pilus secretin PilQ/predicted competence protein